jgi:hypothetical protein
MAKNQKHKDSKSETIRRSFVLRSFNLIVTSIQRFRGVVRTWGDNFFFMLTFLLEFTACLDLLGDCFVLRDLF